MLSYFREFSHSSLLQFLVILATVLNHFSLNNSAQLFLLQCLVILATMLNHSSYYSAEPFSTELQCSVIFHGCSTHASSML
jgi:hypothetical protein